MSEWKAKRFWTEARVIQEDGGYGIALDGRPVRTPGKSPLIVPTAPLAREIAAEWNRQEGKIDPGSMPLTRAANSALEKVAPQKAEVVAMLADYGDADVTCYRAASPAELVRRQAEAWDPLLDWAAAAHNARLIPVEGVMHQAQNATALRNIAEPMDGMSEFQLTGFHDLVSLSGSLVIALAAIARVQDAQTLWNLSRIDEDWQIEKWGVDDEAVSMAEAKQRGFQSGLRFYKLSTKIS